MTAKQIQLNYLGTDYGGWAICLDLVPSESLIISAGVGEDISFDEALITLKKCKILGIDPTPKSHQYIETLNPPNFTLLKGALVGGGESTVKIFKQKNPDYVSESIIESNKNCSDDYHLAPAFNLTSIISQNSSIAVLKLDIEGAEYEMIEEIGNSGIPQVCIEFHHFCTDFSPQDTRAALASLWADGYTTQYTSNNKEYTLIHESALQRIT
mgnify:CR=1 FL=1|tara:strand:+ start:1929 stop:2564 length:636 start_codon:yes stop_codon:yes gene_type:complete